MKHIGVLGFFGIILQGAVSFVRSTQNWEKNALRIIVLKVRDIQVEPYFNMSNFPSNNKAFFISSRQEFVKIWRFAIFFWSNKILNYINFTLIFNECFDILKQLLFIQYSCLSKLISTVKLWRNIDWSRNRKTILINIIPKIYTLWWYI